MSGNPARPISLSDKERKEFDHITLDTMHEWRDVSKLRRLEQYMNQEGFPMTASAAALRIKALSAGSTISDEDQRRELESEFKTSAKDLMSWTRKVVSQEQELSTTPTALSSSTPGIRKGVKIASDAAVTIAPTQKSDVKAKSDSSVGLNARSGSEYYDKWDKLAEAELVKLDVQEKPTCCETTTAASNASSQTAANPENTQRICRAAEGLSLAERQRQAESERHKGNDYFRAHDYTAAVEAFTVATQLDPQSAAARANRAAAYLKLRMWPDAETDAGFALQLEPNNLKARLRRAQARSEMGEMNGAKEDALAVLEKVPDEPTMLALVEKADRALKQPSSKMRIEEVGGDTSADPHSDSVEQESESAPGPTAVASGAVNENSVPPGMSAPPTEAGAPDVPASASAVQDDASDQSGSASVKPVKTPVANATLAGSTPVAILAADASSSAPAAHSGAEESTFASAEPGGKQMRKIPIIMDSSDSDSDDDAIGTTCGTACCGKGDARQTDSGTALPASELCESTAGGVAAVLATAVDAAPHEIAPVAAENGDGGAQQVPQTGVSNADVPIEVVEEDDEGVIAADDALIVAARAHRAELAHESGAARGQDQAKSSGGTAVPGPEGKCTAPTSMRDTAAPAPSGPPPSVPSGAQPGVAPPPAMPVKPAAPPPIKEPQAVAEELLDKGRAAFAAGQLQDAKDHFTAAIAAWPLTAAAYSNRAAVSAKLGVWEHVVEDSSAVLGLANTELLKYKALSRRAKARAQLGDHLGSVRDYKDAEYFVPDAERKALQRETNAAENIVMRAKQEMKLLAAKRAAKKAQKHPLRSTAYGKVTVEELDSDDEDEEPDDDPLALADRTVRRMTLKASEATSDVHARAQALMDKYKEAVAAAAAEAKAAQRAAATAPRPAPASQPAAHQQSVPEPMPVPAPPAASTAPPAASATINQQVSPSTPQVKPTRASAASNPTPAPAAQQTTSTVPATEAAASTVCSQPREHGATPVAAPEGDAAGQRSSSGSDSSYVLVDAPSVEGTDTATAAAAKPAPQGDGCSPAAGAGIPTASVPATPAVAGVGDIKGGDQGKADALRVKGISAWKAGDVSNALGLWSQAAQVAPRDYRVHLNISQALLRLSRHADALAAADTALEALIATPGAPTELMAKAQYRRGVALQDLQRLPEALAALTASHEAMPTPETLAAVTKLREQVAPVPTAAPPVPAEADVSAERAPWDTVVDGTADAASQQHSERRTRSSDGSFVHIARAGSAAGGGASAPRHSGNTGAADSSAAAPAGALRPERVTVSADGSTHTDAGEPSVAVAPASELESVGGSDADAALRRFHVPIQEPPAATDSPVPTADPSTVHLKAQASADSDAAAGAVESAVAAAEQAQTPDHEAKGAAAARTEPVGKGKREVAQQEAVLPESPQELAERALRSGAARGNATAATTTAGGVANSTPIPVPPVPVTAQEFLQATNSLRRAGSTAGAAQAQAALQAYVQSVPPGDYAKIIKSNLDGKVLSEFSGVMKAVVASEKQWCRACLLGLTAVERFGIVLVMLPAAEKKVLVDIKSQLTLTPEEAAALSRVR